MSGAFEDELKETYETLTEEFTCTVTLISLVVVDSYLEDVLCAACRRCVELVKFNTESTALGYARGAEMAWLVPLVPLVTSLARGQGIVHRKGLAWTNQIGQTSSEAF